MDVQIKSSLGVKDRITFCPLSDDVTYLKVTPDGATRATVLLYMSTTQAKELRAQLLRYFPVDADALERAS